MGVHEVAQRLGVGRQRIHQLTGEKDFPVPVKLRCGLVWYEADVELWIRCHRPRLAAPSGPEPGLVPEDRRERFRDAVRPQLHEYGQRGLRRPVVP